MSGIDSKDWGNLKAAAADFPSLPIVRKHLFVAEVIWRWNMNMMRDLRFYRERKTDLIRNHKSSSPYLNMKELEMIWDLDPKEAIKSEEEAYRAISFRVRMQTKEIEQLRKGLKVDDLIYESSYNEDGISDGKNNTANVEYERETETRPRLNAKEIENVMKNVESYHNKIQMKKKESNQYLDMIQLMNKKKQGLNSRPKLKANERKEMPADIESYRKKIEWVMENRMRKKTEFNQLDIYKKR